MCAAADRRLPGASEPWAKAHRPCARSRAATRSATASPSRAPSRSRRSPREPGVDRVPARGDEDVMKMFCTVSSAQHATAASSTAGRATDRRPPETPGCTATFSVTVATVSQRRSAADAPGPWGFRAFSDIPSTSRAVATPAFPRVWLGCRSMSGGRRPIFRRAQSTTAVMTGSRTGRVAGVDVAGGHPGDHPFPKPPQHSPGEAISGHRRPGPCRRRTGSARRWRKGVSIRVLTSTAGIATVNASPVSTPNRGERRQHAGHRQAAASLTADRIGCPRRAPLWHRPRRVHP